MRLLPVKDSENRTFELLVRGVQAPKVAQVIALILGCLPEPDGEILLLKRLHI